MVASEQNTAAGPQPSRHLGRRVHVRTLPIVVRIVRSSPESVDAVLAMTQDWGQL
jgi:hypothetical protein